MKDKFHLGKHELFSYLQLRDYYNKETRRILSLELNGVIQIINKACSKGSVIAIISTFYHAFFMNDKYSTTHIQKKWGKELHIEISNSDFTNM